MIAPHRVCGTGLLVAALAFSPLRADAAASMSSPTELLMEGDEKASNGDHGGAARLYLEAYRGMSADERAEMGDLVVESALESVKKAYGNSSDPALLDVGADLIDAYESDMSGPAPAFLDEARAWLAERRPVAEPDPTKGPYEDPDFPNDDPVGGGDGGFGDTGPTDGDPGKEVVGPALIGVGGALAVTGIILLALGAPAKSEAEQAREEVLGSPEFGSLQMSDQTQATQFSEAYDQYVADETKRGRGLMIGGGILLGVGVGAAAYGIVRVVQHRKKSRSSSAQILPSAGGLTVRF